MNEAQLILVHKMVTKGCELRIRQNLDGGFAARLYDGALGVQTKYAEGIGAALDDALAGAFVAWRAREKLCDCTATGSNPHSGECEVWR